MHWTEDGRIQITRNFALGAAAVIIGLALVMMLLIGMLIAGDGDSDSQADAGPTPTVQADEQDGNTDGSGSPQAASKSEYSTCLARTWRALSLDVKDTEFKPWEERNTTKDAWPIVELRHIDYIGEHCRHLAPAPPESSSATCVPRELQAFYRRHIPENGDTESHQAIAAEYALTVCQPSADR